MTDSISISAFIRRNLPTMFNSFGSPKKAMKFTNWVSWNMGRLNVCVVPRGTKIIGVGIARSISNPLDSRYPYRFDEKGDILYVSLAAAKDHEAFRALLAYCKFRWPHCTRIMFNRKKYNKQVIYNFKRFLELVESKPFERTQL